MNMEIEDATNPEAEGPAPEAEMEVDEHMAAGEAELDENGNPFGDQAEQDSEEFEHEGEKYKIPRAVKPLLMMQADYTRKTQELAEQRRAVEAERAGVRQASHEELQAQARLVGLDQQIAALSRVNWQQAFDEDPFEAQKAFASFQQMKDAHGTLAAHVGRLQQQRAEWTQRETARRLQESYAALTDPVQGIKGWNDQYAARLLETGVRDYGFERSEIEAFEDHRMVRVLDDAAKWREHTKKQQQAQRHVAAQSVKPAARVGGKSSPPAGLDDRLSADEWVRRREAQLRGAARK
jgi:hypothetical protein